MKSFRALSGLLLVVAMFYCSYKFLPVYLAAYQFDDAIKEEAKLAAYSQRSDADIQANVFKKAQDFEIPIKPEGIHVQRSNADLNISADYRVHVDLPLFPLDLDFHPSSKGHQFSGV
jgi:Domain of unknown function (DUF4845)